MIVERVITIEYLEPSMAHDLLCKFPDESAFGFDYSQSEIWSPLLPRGRHGSLLESHFEFSGGRTGKSSKGKLKKIKGMFIEKKLNKKKLNKKRMSNMFIKNLDFSSSSSTPVKGWRRVLRAATNKFKGQKRSSLQRLLPTL